MLTGDHHQVAKTIASDLGMTHFLTEILPDQKAAEITEPREASGHKNGSNHTHEWRHSRHSQSYAIKPNPNAHASPKFEMGLWLQSCACSSGGMHSVSAFPKKRRSSSCSSVDL
jgi:magnesium-transporting ATPase (P-type)